MSFSAVSALALALVAVPQAVKHQAPPLESVVWSNVASSVLFIDGAETSVGVAALIDDSGLFLVQTGAVAKKNGTPPNLYVSGRFADGERLNLIVVASDDHTQLSLLKAMTWSTGVRRPLTVASKPTQPNVELVAVTTDGPKLGEFISDGKAGVMRQSLRYVPLSEIRLQGSEDQLGGAIVFDAAGDMIGVLGATLASDKGTRSHDASALAARGGAGGGGAGALNAFGPTNPTVAYALGREVLLRVVQGFKSPSHEVKHPTIGLFFKASPDGRGVLVDSVMLNSPAAAAGIEPGDVILELDGVSVNSPVDMAVMLFRKSVGEKLKVRYARGQNKKTVDVKVVSGQAEEAL